MYSFIFRSIILILTEEIAVMSQMHFTQPKFFCFQIEIKTKADLYFGLPLTGHWDVMGQNFELYRVRYLLPLGRPVYNNFGLTPTD
jgi:hypothetical protein